jgi:hypothetical protein
LLPSPSVRQPKYSKRASIHTHLQPLLTNGNPPSTKADTMLVGSLYPRHGQHARPNQANLNDMSPTDRTRQCPICRPVFPQSSSSRWILGPEPCPEPDEPVYILSDECEPGVLKRASAIMPTRGCPGVCFWGRKLHMEYGVLFVCECVRAFVVWRIGTH